MTPAEASSHRELGQRLAEAEATIAALLSGQIDAVFDAVSETPVLLSQAQQALRASEEQYRQIVEATSDGIIRLDLLDRIFFVNRRFAEMLGCDPVGIVGTSVFDLMSRQGKLVMEAALSAGTESLDVTFCHKDGTEISVNLAASALVDVEGHLIGNLGVVRDVTERKRLQAQLMVSDRMASMGTLAAGVAHEINNPLAAVIANLDYVSENLAPKIIGRDPSKAAPKMSRAWLLDEIKGPLDDAREAADRVRLIVRDLKIFSRSPSDDRRGPVDVKVVMESSLRMAWNEIRHRARVVKLYGQVPPVEANEARLGQVFLNLIVNATQSLPEGQAERNEIRVNTRLSAGQVIVEVSDTGAGIPPENLGRIFDAFFTTKVAGAGTGLGLAICQRIVTDIGGALTVESQVGKGSCFTVTLPIARAEEREAIPFVEVVRVGRRGRILVVDDEEMVLRAVKRSLARDHEVTVVAAAREALALCVSGQRFDLILCDLMMPDMTGMELHKELSRVASEQANSMIFLTGGAFTESGRHFLTDPPREHIEKPFDASNLRAIVGRYLR